MRTGAGEWDGESPRPPQWSMQVEDSKVTVLLDGEPIWSASDECSEAVESVVEGLQGTSRLTPLMVQALLTERTGQVGRTRLNQQ